MASWFVWSALAGVLCLLSALIFVIRRRRRVQAEPHESWSTVGPAGPEAPLDPVGPAAPPAGPIGDPDLAAVLERLTDSDELMMLIGPDGTVISSSAPARHLLQDSLNGDPGITDALRPVNRSGQFDADQHPLFRGLAGEHVDAVPVRLCTVSGVRVGAATVSPVRTTEETLARLVLRLVD